MRHFAEIMEWNYAESEETARFAAFPLGYIFLPVALSW
jgi:hypothetical protein